MTNEALITFRKELKSLTPTELYQLKDNVEQEIADQYWSDSNFFAREKKDNYVYITVNADLTYYYHLYGKKAYDSFVKDPNVVRIECKTKDLYPEFKVLMSKGDLCMTRNSMT